jgi:phytoene dehydrogenase-like protein
MAGFDPGIDRPPEVTSIREQLRRMWGARGDLSHLIHFKKTFKEYQEQHIRDDNLRRVLSRLLPEEAPVFFLVFILGYLCAGQLSRPVGTTERFRDALIDRYGELGGTSRLGATVDEILVRDDRARGVRLADGTIVEADIVVSTSRGEAPTGEMNGRPNVPGEHAYAADLTRYLRSAKS